MLSCLFASDRLLNLSRLSSTLSVIPRMCYPVLTLYMLALHALPAIIQCITAVMITAAVLFCIITVLYLALRSPCCRS